MKVWLCLPLVHTQEPKKQRKKLVTWSIDDVCSWLISLDLDIYCESFRQNAIDGMELSNMTSEVLASDLGIGEWSDTSDLFFSQILWTIDKRASWNDMQNYFPFLYLSLPRFYYGSLGRTVHCDFLKLHWSTKVLDSGHRSSTDVKFCWSKGYFKIIFLDISVMKVIRSHQSPMTDCFYPSIF